MGDKESISQRLPRISITYQRAIGDQVRKTESRILNHKFKNKSTSLAHMGNMITSNPTNNSLSFKLIDQKVKISQIWQYNKHDANYKTRN